jgi:hypothetical protein
MVRVLRANHEWEGTPEATGTPDPDYFRQTIAPELPGHSLRALMDATGLTKSACSRIRRGEVVPHRRHWRSLAKLTQG